MKMRSILGLILGMGVSSALWAQSVQQPRTAVAFEELYDEPYAVNKLFIGFQPLYGEVFATNVNAGFGVETAYYYKNKADFRGHYRQSYGQEFYDLNRDLAEKNSNVQNTPQSFSYFEIGGTYHIKDFEQAGKTKMVLYRKSYKGNKWAGRVPLTTQVPAKVRKIYGARLGGIFWSATADINRIMEKQDLVHGDLLNAQGEGLPATFVDNLGQTRDLRVFSNLTSSGLYLGGSISWIRNVAVSFDTYEEALDDGMLTLFFDILVTPSLTLDPIKYMADNFSTDAVDTKKIGFRLGIDGRFNRTLSWSYGGELGYRPSLSGRGFFAMFKVSFPVFGTNLDNKVEALAK